jgi:hypothetical protein
MIFKEKQNRDLEFSRKISWDEQSVTVVDRMQLPDEAEVKRAPRSSRRHVASANSYHEEDMWLTPSDVLLQESQKVAGKFLEVTTRYESKSIS